MQKQQPPPSYQDDPYDQPPQAPSSYKFDEDMADPFGSKKPTVMNTPPKREPTLGGAPLQQPKSNFVDELASNHTGVVE